MTIIRAGRVVESGALADLRHLDADVDHGRTDRASRPGWRTSPGSTTCASRTTRCAARSTPPTSSELLNRLGGGGVRSLVSQPPTLEELFLRYYGDAADPDDAKAEASGAMSAFAGTGSARPARPASQPHHGGGVGRRVRADRRVLGQGHGRPLPVAGVTGRSGRRRSTARRRWSPCTDASTTRPRSVRSP